MRMSLRKAFSRARPMPRRTRPSPASSRAMRTIICRGARSPRGCSTVRFWTRSKNRKRRIELWRRPCAARSQPICRATPMWYASGLRRVDARRTSGFRGCLRRPPISARPSASSGDGRWGRAVSAPSAAPTISNWARRLRSKTFDSRRSMTAPCSPSAAPARRWKWRRPRAFSIRASAAFMGCSTSRMATRSSRANLSRGRPCVRRCRPSCIWPKRSGFSRNWRIVSRPSTPPTSSIAI